MAASFISPSRLGGVERIASGCWTMASATPRLPLKVRAARNPAAELDPRDIADASDRTGNRVRLDDHRAELFG